MKIQETRDGVLHASVTGLLTLKVFADIRDKLASVLHDEPVACIDCTRALVAVTACDLDRLLQEASLRQTLLAIAWALPNTHEAQAWRRRTERLALVGLRRFATDDLAKARTWCRAQAQQAAARRAQLRACR